MPLWLVVVLIWVVGVPLMVFAVLWLASRRHIDEDEPGGQGREPR